MIRPSFFPFWKIPPFLSLLCTHIFRLLGRSLPFSSMDDMVLFFFFPSLIYSFIFPVLFLILPFFSLTLSGHSLHGKVDLLSRSSIVVTLKILILLSLWLFIFPTHNQFFWPCCLLYGLDCISIPCPYTLEPADPCRVAPSGRPQSSNLCVVITVRYHG